MKADFTRWKAGKYQKHPAAGYPVTGMWCAYFDAYQDRERVEQAMLHPEKSGARILMIAGAMDEAWPSADSVRLLQNALREAGYTKEVKTIVFPHGSHLTGLMPNREREKRLYRMIPLVSLMYRTFGKYRKENMDYFEQSERTIIEWVKSGKHEPVKTFEESIENAREQETPGDPVCAAGGGFLCGQRPAVQAAA